MWLSITLENLERLASQLPMVGGGSGVCGLSLALLKLSHELLRYIMCVFMWSS